MHVVVVVVLMEGGGLKFLKIVTVPEKMQFGDKISFWVFNTGISKTPELLQLQRCKIHYVYCFVWKM